MRKDKNGNIIITTRKGAELFCILGFARNKLNGKIKSDCERYWKELEKVLGLEIKI